MRESRPASATLERLSRDGDSQQQVDEDDDVERAQLGFYPGPKFSGPGLEHGVGSPCQDKAALAALRARARLCQGVNPQDHPPIPSPLTHPRGHVSLLRAPIHRCWEPAGPPRPPLALISGLAHLHVTRRHSMNAPGRGLGVLGAHGATKSRSCTPWSCGRCWSGGEGRACPGRRSRAQSCQGDTNAGGDTSRAVSMQGMHQGGHSPRDSWRLFGSGVLCSRSDWLGI